MLAGMESTGVQLLVGVLAVLGPFAAAGLGAVVLARTPLRPGTDEAFPRGRRR
jgi:hypothetical protein